MKDEVKPHMPADSLSNASAGFPIETFHARQQSSRKGRRDPATSPISDRLWAVTEAMQESR